MKPTLTIPDPSNHGQRFVQWGTAVKVVVGLLAVFGSVVSGLAIAGIVRLFEMSAKLEMIQVQQIDGHERDEEMAGSLRRLTDRIDLLVKSDEDRFLTKDQYYHDMAPEIRRRKGDR